MRISNLLFIYSKLAILFALINFLLNGYFYQRTLVYSKYQSTHFFVPNYLYVLCKGCKVSSHSIETTEKINLPPFRFSKPSISVAETMYSTYDILQDASIFSTLLVEYRPCCRSLAGAQKFQ